MKLILHLVASFAVFSPLTVIIFLYGAIEICYFTTCGTLKAVLCSIRRIAHEHYEYTVYPYTTNIYLVHYDLAVKEEPREKEYNFQ
jgi:hypothetical protein